MFSFAINSSIWNSFLLNIGASPFSGSGPNPCNSVTAEPKRTTSLGTQIFCVLYRHVLNSLKTSSQVNDCLNNFTLEINGNKKFTQNSQLIEVLWLISSGREQSCCHAKDKTLHRTEFLATSGAWLAD